MFKNCRYCAMCDRTQNICALSGTAVNPEVDGCTKGLRELEQCDICRKPLIGAAMVEEVKEGMYIKHCPNCLKVLNSCQLCEKSNICAFETDPNPLPKVVMKTVQQGNMRMQTQVKNEERVKLFCHNCCCWHEEDQLCLKELNSRCGKFSLRYS